MPGDGGCAHNSQGNGKDCHLCDVEDDDHDQDEDGDREDDDVMGIRCALRAV